MANLIALYTHTPLASVDSFTHNLPLYMGSTRAVESGASMPRECEHILLVDDSVDSGDSIRSAISKIQSFSDSLKITVLVAYGSSLDIEGVDIVLEHLPQPRLFSWNISNHIALSKACIDIDGVLCRDPDDSENDDGVNYETFLKDVPPTFITRKRLGYLVSSRIERYREATEDWLARHGYEYEHLFLHPAASGAERIRLGNHAEFKAEIYRKSDKSIFIESSYSQAKRIHELTMKPVFCYDQRVFFTDESYTESANQAISRLNRMSRLLKATIYSLSQMSRNVFNKHP